jgi:4-hydroxy-tetrahydrodipicolinate reductase
MGQTVARLARATGDVAVTGGVVRNAGNPETGVVLTADPVALAGEIDCFIDFSTPDGVVVNLAAMVESGTPYLCGVTGLGDRGHERLADAAMRIPVFCAANFSVGVAVVAALVRQAAAWLPDADVEIVETHHRRKRDAPSGTALALADAIESSREGSSERRVMGRSGEGPRRQDEIGIHSLRAGGNPGEHHILFATEQEEVWIGHRTVSREIFAAGALQAARWLVARPPGLYGMEDLLASAQGADAGGGAP